MAGAARKVADALLLNDDTIRGWHKLFEQRGIEGLTSFDMGGSAGCRLAGLGMSEPPPITARKKICSPP
jgi:hypothetical protein